MGIKKKFFVVVVSLALISLVSCAGKKTQEAPAARGGFSGHQSDLCEVRDDENFFRAQASANGPHPRRDFVKTTAIANAQNEVLVRVSRMVEAEVRQFRESLGSNAGTDVDDALRSSLQSIVSITLGDAAVICGPLYSDIDDKGHLEVIVAIEIRKKEIITKLQDKVKSVLSESDRERLENKLNNIGNGQ